MQSWRERPPTQGRTCGLQANAATEPPSLSCTALRWRLLSHSDRGSGPSSLRSPAWARTPWDVILTAWNFDGHFSNLRLLQCTHWRAITALTALPPLWAQFSLLRKWQMGPFLWQISLDLWWGAPLPLRFPPLLQAGGFAPTGRHPCFSPTFQPRSRGLALWRRGWLTMLKSRRSLNSLSEPTGAIL